MIQSPGGDVYNFNPRSYKRSDGAEYEGQLHGAISIHAPTRGATPKGRGKRRGYDISIHAPTRGATITPEQMAEFKKFQSTLLQEERRFLRCVLAEEFCISIHAPTRGATLLETQRRYALKISIHAPTRGATSSVPHFIHLILFQSTLLQEERR